MSNARNTGMRAATGEVIAYLDDDAIPDPHWLKYLATIFTTTEYAGVGGPNIAPPGDGLVAECIDNAPGNPVHVLISDREAEHIPGCNMAFRKTALEAIGGFDAQCRVAGDDVDVCWRMREHGYTIGYCPAAMVWHHRRETVRAYWKQQWGYGKAEALLECKWPQQYNRVGHVPWSGRIYGKGLAQALGWGRQRIYHGTWGSALFQSIYEPMGNGVWSLPLMPEWYLVIGVLTTLVLWGLFWSPLLVLSFPFFSIAVAVLVAQAILGTQRASFTTDRRPIRKRLLVWYLHMLQPLARLGGRMRYDLTPWRRRSVHGIALPLPRTTTIWHESWRDPNTWLEFLEGQITHVSRGGDYDRWDLEIHGGLLGAVRLRMAIEEHGDGKQLARFRVWPRWSTKGVAVALIAATLAAWAVEERVWVAALPLFGAAFVLMLRAAHECATAMAATLRTLAVVRAGEAP